VQDEVEEYLRMADEYPRKGVELFQKRAIQMQRKKYGLR